MQNNVTAQCFYSPVIAKEYFIGDCGEQYSQNLISVQVPVYGNNDGLYFTSPLTNNVVITATSEVKIGELVIYPNPTMDHLNINWKYAQDACLYIYSQVGQLISQSYLDANTISTIDVQHLLPGYYIVKAVSSHNQTFISKLIKQ